MSPDVAPPPSDEYTQVAPPHRAQDQVKVGGAVIGQYLAGRNRLSTTATLESANFETGSAGFQVDGAGAAEFGDMTVRGTITGATLVGTFQTSTTGAYVKVYDDATVGKIELYSGVATETPAKIYGTASSSKPTLRVIAGYLGGTPQQVVMYEPVTDRRSLTIEAGKPSVGYRGWIYLQPSAGGGEGRANLRGSELAGFLNITTAASGTFGGTYSGGAMAFSEAGPLLNQIAETLVVNFDAAGHGTITYPSSGFANGVLAVNATPVLGWALGGPAVPAIGGTRFFMLDHDGSSNTVLALWCYDDTGAPVNDGVGVSYHAVGW